MRAIILSDLHGFLPEITEKFDLMLICGDICPVDLPHTRTLQEEWLFNEFVDWVKTLPFSDTFAQVVMCAGNHDFVFESFSREKKNRLFSCTGGRLTYLDNEMFNFTRINESGESEGYFIFGCPYCKPFGNWAFMRENLDKYYSVIPENLDILICHDAPDINGLGIIKEGRWAGENAGNPVLAKYIKEVKPAYCFNGHIHSGTHEMFEEEGTKFANVSIMNERYNPIFPPLIIDIEPRAHYVDIID